MTRTTPFIESVKSFIGEQIVVTIPELIGYFNRSRATIFRAFAEIEHVTSYNHNHSGITLTSTPTFNSWGLWKYKKFYFSKWKTLNETIQNIVDKSHTGLYPKELQDILGVRVHNHLSRCVLEKRIVRNNDFGHPVYFSSISEVRIKQTKERTDLFNKRARPKLSPVTKDNIIKILIVIIKHNVTTIDELMPILNTEGIHLSKQSVNWVLKKYDIEKKGSL